MSRKGSFRSFEKDGSRSFPIEGFCAACLWEEPDRELLLKVIEFSHRKAGVSNGGVNNAPAYWLWAYYLSEDKPLIREIAKLYLQTEEASEKPKSLFLGLTKEFRDEKDLDHAKDQDHTVKLGENIAEHIGDMAKNLSVELYERVKRNQEQGEVVEEIESIKEAYRDLLLLGISFSQVGKHLPKPQKSDSRARALSLKQWFRFKLKKADFKGVPLEIPEQMEVLVGIQGKNHQGDILFKWGIQGFRQDYPIRLEVILKGKGASVENTSQKENESQDNGVEISFYSPQLFKAGIMGNKARRGLLSDLKRPDLYQKLYDCLNLQGDSVSNGSPAMDTQL